MKVDLRVAEGGLTSRVRVAFAENRFLGLFTSSSNLAWPLGRAGCSNWNGTLCMLNGRMVGTLVDWETPWMVAVSRQSLSGVAVQFLTTTPATGLPDWFSTRSGSVASAGESSSGPEGGRSLGVMAPLPPAKRNSFVPFLRATGKAR